MNTDFNLKFNAEQNQLEGQFRAEVISLGTKVQENVNGTQYVVGAVRFTNAKGVTVERGAIAYVKNVEKGIQVGETYLCNVTITPSRPTEPIISISPLTNAERASSDDFGVVFEEFMATVGQGAEETV